MGDSVIQSVIGDTLARYFRIKCSANITSVRFICNTLNIDKELEYDEEQNLYKLLLTSEETSVFKPCVADYDIKVYTEDKSVYTGKYRTSLRFLPNVNKGGVTENE